jgi:hypothetical protein
MNQDFAIPFTPANARRLVRFNEFLNIEITPEIAELAETDMISELNFDPFVCVHSKEKEMITQFLLDCNMRGIFQQEYHPSFGEIELLNTVKIHKPDCVTIFSNRENIWAKAGKFLGYQKINFRTFFIKAEDIDKFRTGVLIIDFNFQPEYSHLNKIRDIATEFEKTIVFSPKGKHLESWPALARSLFPLMPSALYPRIVKNVPKEWSQVPICMFATLFNMALFPEFVVDMDLISDDNFSLRQVIN